MTLIAKLGVITLLSEEYDLCELGAKYGTPCPIAAGNINIAITAQVPSAVPSIQVTAFVLGTDADGNQIMCLEGPMTLKAGHAYEPPSQPIESLPSPEIVHVEISSSN